MKLNLIFFVREKLFATIVNELLVLKLLMVTFLSMPSIYKFRVSCVILRFRAKALCPNLGHAILADSSSLRSQ